MPIQTSDMAEATRLYELLPEIFNDKKLWSVLFKEFTDVTIEDNVIEYIRQLDQIRWLSYKDRNTKLRIRSEDEGLLANTAGMLGFNMSFDVYENVKLKLLSHLTQLSLYHQTNGPGHQSLYIDLNGEPASGSFVNFIAYILETTITYKELWSNSTNLLDYNKFSHGIPVGGVERSIQDPLSSNSWFKTTHIDLNVDISNLQVSLVNKDRDGRTFDTRVKELFYAYSPINLVINNIFYGYYAYSNISFIGTLLQPSTLFYTIGKISKTAVSANIQGPSQIYSLTTGAYYLNVLYDDGSTGFLNGDSWSTNNTQLLIIQSNGFAEAGLAVNDTQVSITSYLGTIRCLKLVTILKPVADPVVSCEVIGSNFIYENGVLESYTLQLNTQNGNTYSALSFVSWNVIGFSASMGSKTVSGTGVMTLGVINIAADVQLTLIATFIDSYGVTHTGQKIVQCVDYRPNTIVRLEIRNLFDLPPTTILTPGNIYNYECYAVTLSNTRYIINPIWLTSNKAALVSNFGVVTIPSDISYSYTTDLIASYIYDGKSISASETLSINYVQVKPLRISIAGYGVNTGEHLVSDCSYPYRAVVHWDTGDVTYSPAHWTATMFPVGTDTGILKTGIVDRDTTIVLHAKVMFEGQSGSPALYNPNPDTTSFPILTTSVNLSLLSKQTLLAVVSLSIEGSNIVQVPNYSRYYGFMVKNDSSTYPCPCAWKVTDPDTGNILSHVDINLFSDVASSTYYVELSVPSSLVNYNLCLLYPLIELEAAYVDINGNTFVSKKLVYIVVISPGFNKVISSCDIVGPSSIMAHRRQDYSSVLTYTDGTTATVKSLWYIEIPPQEDNYVVAYLHGSTLTTRTVHGDTAIKLKAQHYTCRMEKTVVIMDNYTDIIDTATCSYIEGPIQVCIGDYASYSLMVHWNNDENPSRESATWKLNDSFAYSYAWIDDEGNLNAFDTVQPPATTLPNGIPYVEIVITAEYTCAATGDISRSMVVQILWCTDKTIRPGIISLCSNTNGILQSVTIFGPATVGEKTNTPYMLLGLYRALDGTNFSRQITADFWELATPDYIHADISMLGDLASKEVDSNKNIVLKACYTDTATTTTYCDTHPVIIIDTFTLRLVRVEIDGVTTMYENSTELFKLKLIMNDGSTSYATSNTTWVITSHSPLPPYLTTTQVNSNFSILASLLPPTMSSDIIDILAEYSQPDGSTLSDTHQVVIAKQLSSLKTVWGYGDFGGVDETFVDANVLTPFPQTSGYSFNVTNAQKYIYFCHPVSLGLATFYFSDTTGNTLVGGMNGASWPLDDIGYDYSPLTITRQHSDGTSSQWYLYRSDFKSVSTFTVKVEYDNA